MANLPRGIQLTEWKNADGSRTHRFRVRIKRADFTADRNFDTLEEAKEFLAASKSKEGRDALDGKTAQQQAIQQAMQDWLTNPTLAHYLDRYAREYLCVELWQDRAGEAHTSSPTKLSGQKATEYRLRTIKSTVLTHTPKERQGLTGHLSGKSIRTALPKKAIGEFRLLEVSSDTASEYIRERRKTAKVSTVQREVNLLQAFFNKLRFVDREAWKKLEENPFETCDKSPLKAGTEEERDEDAGQLDKEAEERLFKALSDCTTKSGKPSEMLPIVALALATGMRRGEILELDWDRVKEDRIVLRSIDTKTRKRRWVPLRAEAKAILDSLPRKDAKVFHYSADGFASNWDRVKKRAKLGDFRFHDCRREFITRILESISSSVVAARAAGFADAKYFDKTYIEPKKQEQALKSGIQSEQDLMNAVGHSSRSITSRYFDPKK